jgi:tetratricopeptide (TPR) repeat protein
LKGRLKASLLPGSTGTENAEAYSLYFQAKQTYLLAQSEDDLRHALAQTNKVVDLDPRFAEVFALRSMLYDDLEMQTKAREAIAKALELAPNLGSAHFVLGRLLIGEYDLLGAEKEFHRALELDPGRWSATGSIAMIEAFRGQFTQSIEGQQTSIASDPVNWELYAQLALVYLYAGRFPESLTAYQRARELRPNGLDQHAWASAVLLAQGKAAEALAELDLVADEDIRLGCGCRTIILDALGRTSEANAALARLIEAHAQNEAYGIAAVYASRGDADRAFEWLDRAHAQREFALHWVKVDPVFKRIRNDRRFHALLLKLHLV